MIINIVLFKLFEQKMQKPLLDFLRVSTHDSSIDSVNRKPNTEN